MTVQARATRFDVLRVPLVGSFLRWRYSRFVLQIPLFLLALLAIFDGFTGRQIAPVNVATVSVWVHYRGLVALAIAIVGNLFCAACPLMLTRGPSKFLSRFIPKLEFPKMLSNKYLVLGLTFLFLFCYEFFDLWASPFLTAWLMIGYFAAALIVDTLFPAGTFCKYVCPLGNFNFAISGASPTQITAINPSVCTSCEGKYCLNGREETATTRAPLFGNRSEHVLLELPMAGESHATRGSFPGCETDLFVPAITTNTDCTLCLNCVRACPYDNVALEVRSPIREAITVRPKADWAFFITVLTWAGLVNAFAMIPTFFSFAASLSSFLGTRSEAVLLLVIQGFGILGGVALSSLAARLSGAKLRDYSSVLLPMCLGIWGGHYLFHFITGYATLLPNIVTALQNLGLPLADLPKPSIPRSDGIFPVQVVITYVALAASGYAAFQKASVASNGNSRSLILKLLPQILVLLLIATITLLIFSQPMQARGSLLT
jgi:polyferredoxin